MKKVVFLLLIFLTTQLIAQSERFPKFEDCNVSSQTELKKCFYEETKKRFFEHFKTPKDVAQENYNDLVNVQFVVTTDGKFKPIYVNSPYSSIKQETERVFANFPKVTPASYNNHAVEMRFVLPVKFPIEENSTEVVMEETTAPKQDLQEVVTQQKLADSTFLEVNSNLNIPFTHQYYSNFEYELNKQKEFHTASKPYSFAEVNKSYNFSEERKKLLKPEVTSWFGRKLWNEHLLQIKKKDYWFTLDFLVDVQLGKDNSDNQSYTYNNTRLATINGGFGKDVVYSATVYESQGRFAEYINEYSRNNDKQTFKPVSSEGLVPGRGKAKEFGTGFDYPVAEGYVAYKPSKYFNVQFGHGKNFIGDGYRSFLLSDVSSPMTYLKLDVEFWRFKYTTIWNWALDVREFAANANNREHIRKYVAMHYLSINLSDRFTLGLFEGAVSTGEGLDASFFNPLMFYRSVEFNRGEDVGNAVLGLTGKYKFSDKVVGYGQLLVDEFSFGNLDSLGKWQNKFALQLGAKYFNAFNVENLFLQGEFNYARPYTFAHANPVLNYGHYSQPLGHLWGANFWELVGIARYKKGRWSGYGKMILGKKGFDLSPDVSYGGNIYQSYNIRYSDTDNAIAQGNTATIFMLDAQANYLLNPSNRLSLFAGASYRNFSSKQPNSIFSSGSNVWFTLGMRADLFNWYFDF